MNGRYFLDTNVFAYAFDSRAPKKAARASELIEAALRTGGGMVSYQVVQEFFHVAFRRFSPAMTPSEAEQYLATTFRPLLAVHSSPALFAAALQLASRHRLAWFDSLVVASAMEGQCSVLYSEDFQDGRKFEGLKVVNPFR